MSEPHLHPSVKVWVNRLGKRYKKLQADTRQLRKDINAFIYRTDAVLVQFKDFTDRVLLLLGDFSIPESIIQPQTDLSDTLSDMMHKHMALVLGLTQSAKSKTDPMLDFEKLLETAIGQLQQLHTDKEASLAEVARLEQQLDEFDQTLLEMNTTLGNCYTSTQEMQAILNSNIN